MHASPPMTAEAHVVAIAYPVDRLRGWKWSGDYTGIALVAAFANALKGALLAQRPDHYKNFTVVGIFLMALLMGLGGGAIGYFTAYIKGQLFREGYFQVLTSFSPPLYAVTARAGVSRPVGERYGRFEMTAQPARGQHIGISLRRRGEPQLAGGLTS